jgi:hypothetical protein
VSQIQVLFVEEQIPCPLQPQSIEQSLPFLPLKHLHTFGAVQTPLKLHELVQIGIAQYAPFHPA